MKCPRTLLALALVAALAAGCDGSSACTAGSIQQCPCDDVGGRALQTCSRDGGWGGCSCGLSNEYCDLCKTVIKDEYACLDGGTAVESIDDCFKIGCDAYKEITEKDFCRIYWSVHMVQFARFAHAKDTVEEVCSLSSYCTLYPTGSR